MQQSACLCMQPDTRLDTLVCVEHTLREAVHLVLNILSGTGAIISDAAYLSGVISGHSHLSVIWQRCSSTRVSLNQSCWSKSSQNISPSCGTPLWGMLTMAGYHENHFGAAVVTKAHWKKPSNVSSFTGWRAPLTFNSSFSSRSNLGSQIQIKYLSADFVHDLVQ